MAELLILDTLLCAADIGFAVQGFLASSIPCLLFAVCLFLLGLKLLLGSIFSLLFYLDSRGERAAVEG
ncbi:MAG: hypothetical protein QOD99_1061 [Chthoniobacter sp.]|nr:hypothetical protein [Chthoniobacter sp.]